MYTLIINWASAFDVVAFGFTMVFILLILLVVVITVFGKVLAPKVRILKSPKIDSNNVNTIKEVETEYVEDHLPAVYGAAIAMAIHLYYAEVHDEESHVITIKTVERRYSPWSSKIYGINNLVK